jgi:DNA-binding MarR family transcriptional regulator
MLLVDLRERMTRTVVPRDATLGSVAQLVLLAHLQGQRMDVLSLADAASRLGYSPMMLTKAKDELVAAGLCTVRAEGRALRLSFAAEGRALWEKALSRLSTPVVRTQLVRFPPAVQAPAGFVRAGVSALSDLTSLADDALVTYASSKAVAAAAGSRLQRVDLEEDASARLELWRHAPGLLTADGRVDALSLYLSLRDNPDERVQGAMSDLLENLRW